MKKLLIVIPIVFLLPALCIGIAFAAPVYIDNFTDFPAYPYNTGAYMVGGRYVGCGPTTGAMIFGYFQHYFGLVDLLDNPVAGINEGLDTAWELHHNYMMTQADGFGSVLNIKPGLEGYAADRGHEVTVMAHAPVGEDPATSWYNDYGAYGDAWMDDGVFWVDLGGDNWEIDPDLFCDFVEPKFSLGICMFLTVDSDGDTWGDHWVPCVGTDRATDEFYFYDTYSTALQSATIEYCQQPGGAGFNAIAFVRSVEYIPTATGDLSGQVTDANTGLPIMGATVTADGLTTTTGAGGYYGFAIPEGTYDVTAQMPGYQSQTASGVGVSAGAQQIQNFALVPSPPGAPVASFTESAHTAPVGTHIAFDPSASHDPDGTIVLYEWDFDGDGVYDLSTVTPDMVSNAWGIPGTYTVTLRVTDNDGLTDTATATKDIMPIGVIPEVPLGTIMASAAMIIALVAYIAVPKWRRKQQIVNL